MTKTVTRLAAISLALLLGVATFSLYAFQASADRGGDWNDDRGGDGDRTEIEVENEGTRVSNNVTVSANTGGNDANGGDSGQSAGPRPPRPGGLSLYSMPTSGGQAGPGGNGGSITTGAATAYGTVANDVNSTNVLVEGCGCEEGSRYDFLSRHFMPKNDDSKRLEIEVENEDTAVSNTINVRANTGRNDANGGNSQGGSSVFNPWTLWFGHHADRSGGDGGTIRTGVAYADGLVTNVVNRTVVRVLNGETEDEEDEDPV